MKKVSNESERMKNEITDLLKNRGNWHDDDFDIFSVRFIRMSDDMTTENILYVEACTFSKLDIALLTEYAKQHGMNEFDIETNTHDETDIPTVSIRFYNLTFKL